jgi:hypothetical protein
MTATFEKDLRAALERACQAQNVANIIQGRRETLALPRETVLQNIERLAAVSLPLNDEWVFRRLLEIYELLDRGLLGRLVQTGLASGNAEIKEAAKDFRERV